jgi:two-component system response regulator AtoC
MQRRAQVSWQRPCIWAVEQGACPDETLHLRDDLMPLTSIPDGPSVRESLGTSNGASWFVPSVSTAMRQIERTVSDIAPTDLPVLISGESGTGKGALAEHIHQLSKRDEGSFVKINCAALTPKSFQERWADSWSTWPANGTLLLDEIAELEISCQRSLLKAIPDAETGGQKAKVRVIAATGCNLQKELRSGRFREDLYYRISGICLRLPSLRQRKEDIPILTDCFLSKYAAQFGKQKPQLSSCAMATFLEYGWPGNIRQLEYTVQRIVALGDEALALEGLSVARPPAPDHGIQDGVSLKQAARAASRQAERELILKVLARTRWNRKLAAHQLQISYKALLYKLKQMGADSSESQ